MSSEERARKFYLRLECVNLSSMLDDTNQISVIRGGSLLLRQAVKDVESRFGRDLKRISTGASIGLFEIKGNDAKTVQSDVVGYLFRDYKHFTFVVDVQPTSGDFVFDKEALLARNRFRQMQQLSLAVPSANANGTIGPCGLDGLRPADSRKEIRYEEEQMQVSDSVWTRYDHGVRQKQSFYREATKENGVVQDNIHHLEFTHDLNEISSKGCFPKLENKLAVIYLDGNGFGKIKAIYCPNADALCRFDEEIQKKRREYLRSFLLAITNDEDFKTWNGKIRLETLLWGGDEITLVVPAWKGFKAMQYFFEQSATWKFHDEELTHAGGLVFCHVKTPIARIRLLARELAESVKARPGGRTHNGYDYVVLESIDFPTEPLSEFWKHRCGWLTDSRASLPAIGDWKGKETEIRSCLHEISKGQVYAVVQAALRGATRDEAEFAFRQRRERFKEVVGEDRFVKAKDLVEKLFPGSGEIWPWLHLVDLWDYLVPERA